MLNVALPKKVEYIAGAEPNQGSIVVEPCFPGFGVTLGNSIRRVLLSSLPGAAVIGVKIDKVSHEFMTLPHLREDILEFTMNLKKLRLRVHSNEVVKLELEVHGTKEIKASDITKNSDVEIVNPDLVLGHIVDMSGHLKADLYVKRGLGYEMIENRENKEKDINYIEIDSIYSPVLATGIKVDYVRVGKQTNYDKLILNIKTDGTISPEEAFDRSVRILMDQFSSLLPLFEKRYDEFEAAETETEPDMDESVKETVAEAFSSDNLAVDENEEITSEVTEDQPKKKRGRPKKAE